MVASMLVLGQLYCAPVMAKTQPLIGAQIWIEPGQTPEQIDGWFCTMAEARMPVVRLFMMWNYLEPAPNQWDWTLYDAAFRAAEKYKVRIVATLTPHHGPAHRGYWYSTQGAGLVTTAERLREVEKYIAQVVQRYRSSPALDTWMLMNEPGQRPSPDPLAITGFQRWLKEKYGTVAKLNQAWITNFPSFGAIEYSGEWGGGAFAWAVPTIDWFTFWRQHQTEQLGWIAQQIRRHDTRHPIHANPHALVGNLANLAVDMPAWRSFLTSLGASIHPGWHFGLLARDQYALGVSYVNDLIRGASEPHPFWVTELQGGNNIYSATRPLNPSPDDIAQWVWTSVAGGADRVIFWLLNARRQGVEAAEWSLTDLQGRPSERLRAAAEIARVIDDNASFFANAQPVDSPITIILSLETMTVQERFARDDYPGRDRNAHVLSALAFYQALSRLGIPARIKHIHDYDWHARTRAPRLAILPHVSVLSKAQARDISAFVKNGNTVLVEGLTGFYAPDTTAWPLSRHPLEDILGARLEEVRMIAAKTGIALQGPTAMLPVHLWVGEIETVSARAMGTKNRWTVAVRNQAGAGEAIWIPSMIGLGAWLYDSRPLAELLHELTAPFTRDLPFRFAQYSPACLMRTLRSGKGYLTVVTNRTAEPAVCHVQAKITARPRLLRRAARFDVSQGTADVRLDARGTSVVMWQ